MLMAMVAVLGVALAVRLESMVAFYLSLAKYAFHLAVRG
jgi:hypothetical protein